MTISTAVVRSGKRVPIANTYEKSKKINEKKVAYESLDLLDSSLQVSRSSKALMDVIRIEERTETLIHELKAFIYPTYFDAVKFEKSVSVFETKLSDIISALEDLKLFKEEVVQKIVFVRCMYETMVSSCAYMNTFNSTSNHVDYLVCIIIELNVMMLSLFNSDGKPDASISGYAKEVGRLSQFLMDWKINATTLKVVPISIKKIFDNQVAQAEKTLFGLKAVIQK